MTKQILFIDNTAHHLFGQLHNIHAMRDAGFQVKLLIPNDGVYFTKLQALGYECIADIQTWRGQNPLAELSLLLRLKECLTSINPDVVCSFTIKPNLYTAILNKKQRFTQVANITGLGYAFMKNKLKAFFFTLLYRYAFSSIRYVFFQNQDDYRYLAQLKIFSANNQIQILPGSGVNLTQFNYIKPQDNKIFTFLYSGRIIADKGLYELISAFKKLYSINKNVRLVMIGNFFPDNPSAINQTEFNGWLENGIIEYLGMVDNVAEVIAAADCIILPSYREGMPRSILEASSVGRPVITVDSIGCRDAVEDGVTGLIARVKDYQDLFVKMQQMVLLPYEQRVRMGLNGRKKIEAEFDQRVVVSKYIDVVNVI